MINRFIATCLLVIVFGLPSLGQADDDAFGQILQIHTDLCSFRGLPSWLLIVRDLDHGINIPYLYDFRQGQNFWMALTHSRNYLITASQLQFHIYSFKENIFRSYTVNNFCGLESNGRIIHGDSFSIRITGDLKPYSQTLQCNVSQYPDLMALNAMRTNP